MKTDLLSNHDMSFELRHVYDTCHMEEGLGDDEDRLVEYADFQPPAGRKRRARFEAIATSRDLDNHDLHSALQRTID